MTAATGTRAGGGLAQLSSHPADHPLAWMTRARRDAAAWVDGHGFPTRKAEDWRYTRIGPILDAPLEAASGGADPRSAADAVDSLDLGLGGPRLVFVDGRVVPDLSRLEGLPRGATVTSLAAALAEDCDDLEALLAPPPDSYRHAFRALNAALAEDGAFVRLPAGAAVDHPIELVFYSGASGRPVVSSPRSVILAGAGSRAVVVETYAGAAGAGYCTAAVTEVVLGEDASVEHYKVQDEAEDAFHLASLDVRLERASRFTSRSLALGSSISRHEVQIRLVGEGAVAEIDGLYTPRGDQQHDNPVLVEHVAPGCISRQRYKGIADERGHGVFNGHIIVHPGAFGTEASQTNKNLLLSDHAEIDTRPRLEIHADDVMCTHGAAVGRLDEDALFYLRSRGIPLRAARALLTYGFAREMIEPFRPAALRARVEELLAERLEGGGGQIEGGSWAEPAPDGAGATAASGDETAASGGETAASGGRRR